MTSATLIGYHCQERFALPGPDNVPLPGTIDGLRVYSIVVMYYSKYMEGLHTLLCRSTTTNTHTGEPSIQPVLGIEHVPTTLSR